MMMMMVATMTTTGIATAPRQLKFLLWLWKCIVFVVAVDVVVVVVFFFLLLSVVIIIVDVVIIVRMVSQFPHDVAIDRDVLGLCLTLS